MPTEPMAPRLRIVFSMSSSMMPSVEGMQVPRRARTADWTAEETPEATFIAQPTLAPSHTMPVMLPIMFLMAAHTCS